MSWGASGNGWPALIDLNSSTIEGEEGDIAGVELNLGSINVVWSLGVIVAWVSVGGDLSWSASSDRWPLRFELNLGSVDVVRSLRVVITWVGVSGDLSRGTSGN